MLTTITKRERSRSNSLGTFKKFWLQKGSRSFLCLGFDNLANFAYTESWEKLESKEPIALTVELQEVMH